MKDSGARPRGPSREPDSTVRMRTQVLEGRALDVAVSVAPDVDKLIAALDARVSACDHLAFDEITGRIAYRAGDRVLFEGVVEELGRVGRDGVLTFAWRAHPDAPPPTPRVETARHMLRGLGLHALLLGEVAVDGASPSDLGLLLRLGLHFYEADGLFHEERGGATVYYAVFEGAAPERPGRSGKLGQTMAHFRVPRTTSRPIPREEEDAGAAPREESIIVPPVNVVAPVAAAYAIEPPPATERAPALVAILPIAQVVFGDLATDLATVRKAMLLVHVLRGLPRIVLVDLFATDGDGELREFRPSPSLCRAVDEMLDEEEQKGNASFSRLIVEMSADTSIDIRVR